MNHRHTLVSALMLALGGSLFSSASIAQPMDCTGMGPMNGPRAEMRTQRMQQRQQQLHDALKLTSDQEKAWGRFQETRPQAMMQALRSERPDPATMTAPERAERMLEWQKKHQDVMTQHLAALKEFYAQLTPEQQKRFDQYHMPRPPRAGGRGPGAAAPAPAPAPDAPAAPR